MNPVFIMDCEYFMFLFRAINGAEEMAGSQS